MENPTVSGLRSRSRSKTPFLRSSCDRENCVEGEEHTHHKSGRKTPVKRSTPIKQLGQSSSKRTSETITEVEEEATSPPAHRTRLSTRGAIDKLARTSDYSSEESLDRLKGHRKEIFQNEINSQYERVSTSSQRYTSLSDVTLSPIHTAHSLTHDRSRSRIGSPACSACSTDSSFAEQALADTSLLLEINPDSQHLPSRLYKMAREYWNKYPKTDYTYSPLSRDRVELAPGQVAMPNMSRRSLSQFRVQGALTSADELERLSAASSWTTTTRKRYTSVDSSDDESQYVHKQFADERWWITRVLVSLSSAVSGAAARAYRHVVAPAHRYPYTDRRPAKAHSAPPPAPTDTWSRPRTGTPTPTDDPLKCAAARAYRHVVAPAHRYPYTDRRPAKASVGARAAAAATAPFRWLVVLLTTIVTTTVTSITTVTETVTETVSPQRAAGGGKRAERAVARRWPWLLLLLLLASLGYGWYRGHAGVPPPERAPAPPAGHAELGARLAALERWALDADARLLAAGRVERRPARLLRDELLRALAAGDTAAALADELRKHLDRDYVTREQMDVISADVQARALHDRLGEFERRQLDVVREYLREHAHEHAHGHAHGHARAGDADEEAVRRVVAAMLDVYDADKTGLVDYALESAGGQVISTKCTELYQIKTKQYSILGLPVLWVYTSPRYALTPGAMPAECWAFQGFPGYLVVRTYAIIEVTGFSLEHMSRLLAVDGKIESAPKNFSVYGLHGEMDTEPHLFGDYMYDANGTAIQYFPVQHPKSTDIGGVQYPVAFDMIELRVESNHGNPTYTCVYRFRVHGNPLSDVRRAAADTIRDSET